MLVELLAGPFGPVLIFLLRIVDVSMATVRTLLVVRGARWLPPLIGFFEVMIWILAVGSAIQNLTSPLHVLGYAAGFATGNAAGLWFEERLALGFATIRTVTTKEASLLTGTLRENGYPITEFPGQGHSGPVSLIYSVVPRRAVGGLIKMIEQIDPDAFVVVDEPRKVRRGPTFDKRRR